MRTTIVPALLVLVACGDETAMSTRDNALTGAAETQATSPIAVREEAPPLVFNTELRADQEPANASTSTSKGHAQIKVLADGTLEGFIMINNKSDETFTRVHIHKAAAGVNGPIHWDFLEAGVPVASIGDQPATLRTVGRPRAAAVLADLLANPDLYYVNVHSTVFPGGAIRGQLQ